MTTFVLINKYSNVTIMKQDTICAIATAPGGAIGIIRVSGPDAIAATSRIFTPAGGAPLNERDPYTVSFGRIMSGSDVIDEVLVTLFRAPHSYTGEDSTEISCHGSSYILQQVVQLLIAGGCRMAHPGEYTQRAFLNGKMDLSQAEAVADLIASTSAAGHRMAMNQMRGGFSRELSALRDKLLHFTSLIELELDFSDHEELEFADRTKLYALAEEIERAVSRLIGSFRVGNAIKNGIPVAIVGETNAGKSTLLNALLHEEKAIVSDIHGTTRDSIEDTFVLQGITYRFIDTAGIRSTNDEIENIGIQRAFSKMDQAQIVLWVVDTTETSTDYAELKQRILPHCTDKELIVIFNKCDRTEPARRDVLSRTFADVHSRQIFISASTGYNLPVLEEAIIDASHLPGADENSVIVSSLRHVAALNHALECIHRVQDGLNTSLPGDLISQDLRECIYALGEIVADGGISPEETLHNIFKNFCIGK
jgi:tRNA modification GTPase